MDGSRCHASSRRRSDFLANDDSGEFWNAEDGMSDASKAVFLSYAREDSVAAQRIAEALRAGGVEVWFDQS